MFKGWGAPIGPESIAEHMSYSLNSLKGDYIGVSLKGLYRGVYRV